MKNKLLLINSLKQGGAERVVLSLVDEINNDNLKVLLLENTVFYKTKNTVNFLNEIEKNNIIKFLELAFLAIKLNNFCKKNEISLIQSHLPRSNYVNILAKIIGGKHVVQIVSHGIPSLYRNRGLLGRINLLLIKFLYHKADKHIVVSNGLKYDFNNLYRVRNNFTTIHNPFPVKEIIKDSLVEIKNFKFTENIFYFIFCGRLNKVKKIDQLIDWFIEFSSNNNKVSLILLGDGELKNIINAKLISESVSNIHLLGSVLNPYSYISKSSCLILNSDFEGFGNVIIESLICKTPVISVDCDYGPREILNMENNTYKDGNIKHNEYSIMFKQNDKVAFFNALRLMIDDFSNFKTGASKWNYQYSDKFEAKNISIKYKEILGLK